MTCGIVYKARGGQVFDKLSTVADDWYLRALHEPIYARIGKTHRSEIPAGSHSRA